jgi:tripartite-type tricarboxylate transporter receptor subunit TctC
MSFYGPPPVSTEPAGTHQVTYRHPKGFEFTIPHGNSRFEKMALFLVDVINDKPYYDRLVIPVRPMTTDAAHLQRIIHMKSGKNTVLVSWNSTITAPLFQALPFSYRDTTPIAILALEDFVLWVNSETPWKSAQDFISEAKSRSVVAGGIGWKSSDEIVFRLIEQAADTIPFEYAPARWGGRVVAKALAEGEIEATVNQFTEIKEYYPGKARPLCVFRDESLKLPDGRIVPSCREAGIDVNYNDFMAVFAPPEISAEHKAKLVKLFEDVLKDKMWTTYAEFMGWRPYLLTGDAMEAYLADMERVHIDLFKKQGWIK